MCMRLRQKRGESRAILLVDLRVAVIVKFTSCGMNDQKTEGQSQRMPKEHESTSIER